MATTNHHWELEDGSAVAVVLDERNKIHQLRVTAPRGQSVTGATVRKIPLSRLIAEIAGPTAAPPLQLVQPDGRWTRKTDEFYQSAADAFLWLSRTSPRPATVLADANSVPVTTVHRWVREARRRGLLTVGVRSGGRSA